MKQLIDRMNVLLGESTPDPARVDEVLAGVAALSPRDLVRFDEQSRSWLSGLDGRKIPRLRGAPSDEDDRGLWASLTRRRPPAPAEPTPAALALWHVLGLVTGDGYERERVVRAVPLTILSARLLAIRCIDWVHEVRDAALSRLDECPHDLLVEALPLVTQLAAERARGQVLDALLDARLSNDDLRRAYAADDPRSRRAAWQRLAARDVMTPEELFDVAAFDDDVVVRAVAADALPGLPAEWKRRVAERLVRDPVGWIAAQALAVLVELDGTDAIVSALTARTAALRRAARDWASIKGVDARLIYLDRLKDQAQDAVALIALAEMADARDTDLFAGMLDDPRSRVRAAGLRALARVDRSTGRRAAIEVLDAGATGRVTWAAAQVLRVGVPSSAENVVLARVALDSSRAHRKNARGLWIPNRDKGSWDASDPICHTELLTAEPRSLRRFRARIIRMAKSANKSNGKPVLISFNIEALGLEIIAVVSSLAEGLELFFREAAISIRAGLTDDPAGVSGEIKLPEEITRTAAAKRLDFFADQVAEARDADTRAGAEEALAELYPDHLPHAARSSKAQLAASLRSGNSSPRAIHAFGLGSTGLKTTRSYGDA